MHHFSPIGAMFFERQLARPKGDIETIALAFAEDVGVSEAEARAFLNSISNGQSVCATGFQPG